MNSKKQSLWVCDKCNRTLDHGEFRYNCTVCDDYDYCENCVMTSSPKHPHQMVRELAYGRGGRKKVRSNDMATLIETTVEKYSDRHCLGVRNLSDNTYSWITFQTIGDRAKNFGRGLRRFIEPRQYLAISAANRPEWIITDFACMFQSIISVPMYTLFNNDEINYVINNTQISVVVCDKNMLLKFIKLHSKLASLRHIICMDPIPTEMQSTKDIDICLHYMNDIEQNGANERYHNVFTNPDDPLTIVYTSGSSGLPKGAIISENLFRTSFIEASKDSSEMDYVHFSYQPLAWLADRDATIATFAYGGRTAFSSDDPSCLMEELSLVRPSDFSASPSLFNKIYMEYKTLLALKVTDKSSETMANEEQQLLQQFSKLIPHRCKIIVTGGAMVSSEVLNFMRRCFTHCTVYESYGATECGGIAYDDAVINTTNYRLASDFEMGYTLDDKPYPRGELLVKTSQMFSGYVNNQEETRAALTDDGFFRTGDIVELRTDQNGQSNIRVIDRRKNFFKLSQGQFISPEYLQNIYMQSLFIEQIYIHGDLLSDCVSAVIVPNREYAHAFVIKHNIADFDTKNPDRNFIDAILDDLHLIGEKALLRKYEIPSKIIVDFEPFSADNGLLTSSLKQCRYKIAQHYADRLKGLNSIDEKLKSILETALEQKLIWNHIDENVFQNLGGDSLSAIRLHKIIEKDLGLSIPISTLFHPEMTIERFTSIVKNSEELPRFVQSIKSDLIKDVTFDFKINIDQYKSMDRSPSMVFITGATGFVGAFLLEELLNSYPKECKFICLVRCDPLTNPLDRIRQSMLFYKIWNDKYDQRIVPLRGDLSKIYFDLNYTQYQSLAKQVDLIFHCGATVNFFLPYHKLYGSNVIGTREIIRFATLIPSACIPIHHISTISILSSTIRNETSIDEITCDELIDGYTQTKWVAEKLLNNVKQLSLPVKIYRLGLVCADSRSGACNLHDLYTLLFSQLIKLKCYPESIIDSDFTGLPVDFTAKSIVFLSRLLIQPDEGIYHIINPTDRIAFQDIINCIRGELDIQLTELSLDEWKEKVNTIDSRNAAFQLARESTLIEHDTRNENSISTEKFVSAMKTFNFPLTGKSYIAKWIRFIYYNI